MPVLNLERLRETLLRGGIAPKHVRRYIAELNDHADDLAQVEIANGHTAKQAAENAWHKLGPEDILAANMLARTELYSLGARYPRLFYGAGPAVTLGLIYVLAVLSLIGGILLTKAIVGIEVTTALRGIETPLGVYFWLIEYAFPVAVGIGFVANAMSQRINPMWVVVGVVVIALMGGVADIAVEWPTAEGLKGELRFGFGWFPPFPEVENSLFRVGMNLVLTAPALVWMTIIHRRREVTSPSP